jgi:hypothetical protein
VLNGLGAAPGELREVDHLLDLPVVVDVEKVQPDAMLDLLTVPAGVRSCPWVGNDAAKQGGKYCVLQHAQDNGCTIPSGNNIPTTTVGSKKYLCYDFAGCRAGYPVKGCTFDGSHTPASVDDGTSTGDDGLKAFIPPPTWAFIAQF